MSHTRKSPGEGSITQRPDGRWQASLQVEGTRRTVYGKTRTEAAEKLRTLADQARQNGHRLPDPGKLTLGDYLDDWLEQAEGRLRPKTLDRYDVAIRCHVRPTLGKLTLAKLTPLHLARLYAALRKETGLPSIEKVHRTLHKALGDAWRWGLIAANPAETVEPPRAEPKEPTLWTPEEASRFVRAMLDGEGGHYGNLFGFLLASGCREGEALGLTWPDVDLEAASVRIDRQITHVANHPVELPPKSRAGHRSIILPGWGVEALRRQRAQVAEWRLKMGEGWRGGEHVFTTEHGTPPAPTNVRRAFLALCARLGLPPIRVHDLRHLHLSLLAMANVPVKVAQVRAGHSSPTLTQRVYQHVLGADDADRQAAEALARALGG